MKNIKIASAIALALGIAAAGSASAVTANGNGGTITFTGALTDQTCTVKGGSGTDGGTGNFIVALDAIPAATLDAIGRQAAWKAFDVVIGGPGQTNCAQGTVAHMSFDIASPRIDGATGALENALAGEATNAQVQVTKGDTGHTAIMLNEEASGLQDGTVGADNTTTIKYGAQYLATGAATPGLVSTSVVYRVTYN